MFYERVLGCYWGDGSWRVRKDSGFCYLGWKLVVFFCVGLFFWILIGEGRGLVLFFFLYFCMVVLKIEDGYILNVVISLCCFFFLLDKWVKVFIVSNKLVYFLVFFWIMCFFIYIKFYFFYCFLFSWLVVGCSFGRFMWGVYWVWLCGVWYFFWVYFLLEEELGILGFVFSFVFKLYF